VKNPRGVHAVEVLENLQGVTLGGLIAAAYDGHLTAFDVLLPPLLKAYDGLARVDPLVSSLREPIGTLRNWDRRTSADSVATALAIFWGNALVDLKGAQAREADEPVYDFLADKLSDAERLSALGTAVAALERDFGGWRVALGRGESLSTAHRRYRAALRRREAQSAGGIRSSQWGALASFDSSKPRSTRKIYGSVGNSFVAAVEFGTPVRAKAIMSGGESGHSRLGSFPPTRQSCIAGVNFATCCSSRRTLRRTPNAPTIRAIPNRRRRRHSIGPGELAAL